jgi:hypothetical protein
LKNSGTNPDGVFSGYGTDIDIIVPSDRKGCFIQRSATGAGKVSVDNVQLTWEWGVDGLSGTQSARIKVFAIEMICVPKGSFYLGDGNGTTGSSYSFHTGSTVNAVHITSALCKNIMTDAGAGDDDQITVTGIGIDGDSGVDIDNNGSIDNAGFPTGYTSFYAMKYEITEEQWVGFFNTLDPAAKSRRDITSASGKNSDDPVKRNTVSWPGIGSASTARPDRACGYLSWADICAYADWAALRPMTELEYEKIARGANAPVVTEYAWGGVAIESATGIASAEDGTETVSNAAANACYGNVTFNGGDGGAGPLRSGIFATSLSTRKTSGAGYYGAMELTGNLAEKYISAGAREGRSFAGTHGDGALENTSGSEGNANNADWPGYVEGQGVTEAQGTGTRGGCWEDTDLAAFTVSGRTKASSADTTRSSGSGGRLGRTEL